MSFKITKQTTWHPSKMKECSYHPACTRVDQHSDADINRLKADVEKNGIRTPIQVQDGTGLVVNGRGRIHVARMLNVPIPVDVLEITDSECWSLSKSAICHRTLTPARAAKLYLELDDEEEKALQAENAADLAVTKGDAPDPDAEDEDEGDEKPKAKKGKKAKKEKRAERGEGKKSKKQAKAAGVSSATMERMKKIKSKGIPALWKAVDDIKVSAQDAAALCDHPHEEQRKALNLFKEGAYKTLKAAHNAVVKEQSGDQLLDAKKGVVPAKLRRVFEDRLDFATCKENCMDCVRQLRKLIKGESGKYLPSDLPQTLEDAAKALDSYQPYVVDESAEFGWLTKHSYDAKK